MIMTMVIIVMVMMMMTMMVTMVFDRLALKIRSPAVSLGRHTEMEWIYCACALRKSYGKSRGKFEGR